MATKCTHVKDNGTPCRAWAVRGSDPPLCAAHGGGKAPVGAPTGNQNALKHGVYAGDTPEDDLDAKIADLSRRIDWLIKYIDTHQDELEPTEVVRLLALQGQLTSRLGRLRKDRKKDTAQDDDFTRVLNEALDRLADEWGVQL